VGWKGVCFPIWRGRRGEKEKGRGGGVARERRGRKRERGEKREGKEREEAKQTTVPGAVAKEGCEN